MWGVVTPVAFFFFFLEEVQFPFAAEGERGLVCPCLFLFSSLCIIYSYSGDTCASGLWPLALPAPFQPLLAMPTPICLTGLDGWLPA